jgi:crotonobetainyl-CoA:carnitine CoA-transferase CaiB-like acyl-CoA transferase
VSVCDVGAGSYAAVATLAALVRRGQTGEGARVSVSLFDTMVDWLGYFPHLWWHRREVPARTGMRHPHFCPYGPFPARNAELFGLAVLSPEHWRALCVDVLERPDLLADERLVSNEGRVAHRHELEPILESEFAARSANEWLDRLRAARVPSGAVNDLAAVMEHPQLAHNALVARVGSTSRPLPVIGSPFLVDGVRPKSGPVPDLGQHTNDPLGSSPQ